MSEVRPGQQTGAFVWGVFVRLVAVTYLVTFLSEAPQILGLIGSRGILSVQEFTSAAEQQLAAPVRFLRLPTLFWLNSSDTAIAALPWLGALAALLVLAGVASGLCLCWRSWRSAEIWTGDHLVTRLRFCRSASRSR